ncbi:MAG: hypothetical protein ACE5OT_05325 [Candidatus Hadarchaeaceae archaeon]
MKMVGRKVRQSIISVLGPPLDSLNITFTDLSPRKSLSHTFWQIGWIVVFESNKEILLSTLDMLDACKGLKIPSQTGNTNFNAIVVDCGNSIEVSYKTGPGQFTSSPFKIPRFIPLNKRTFQAFGLMQAECTKRLTYPSFDFSNTTMSVVRFVLDYFEDVWEIPRISWKVYVEYWRGKVNETKKERIIKFWADHLSVHDWQVKVRVGPEERFSKRASLFGTAAVRLNSRIAQVLIMQVLEQVKAIAESNESAAGAYLCGLFAGDGLALEHKGNLATIGLSFNPRSTELDHYAKVLAQVGVRVDKEKLSCDGKKAIFFNHWRDSITLLEVSDGELFLPHRRNAIRFYRGFLANQYVKPLLRLRLFKKRPLMARELANTVKVCKRTANLDLNRCVALGLLRRDGKGTTSSPFLFYLTDKGKTFLKIVEKIERFLKGQ